MNKCGNSKKQHFFWFLFENDMMKKNQVLVTGADWKIRGFFFWWQYILWYLGRATVTRKLSASQPETSFYTSY